VRRPAIGRLCRRPDSSVPIILASLTRAGGHPYAPWSDEPYRSIRQHGVHVPRVISAVLSLPSSSLAGSNAWIFGRAPSTARLTCRSGDGGEARSMVPV